MALTSNGSFDAAVTATDMRALLELLGEVTVVAIDIPIGLLERGRRNCGVEARRVLGSRRATLFVTPPRPVLAAQPYGAALRLSRELEGGGISKQAYGLRAKIFEVDSWAAGPCHAVIEVHPELSFQRMNGGAALPGKKTWAGQMRRRALLAAHGLTIPDELPRIGTAGADDVLDAAAAAWTARRYARDAATSLPNPPQQLPGGGRCAIWT